MLSKAVKDHRPDVGLNGHYKASANASKPLPSSTINTSRSLQPTSSNPLKRTASQASGKDNMWGSQEEMGRKRNNVDLARASQEGGRLDQLHVNVFYDENDFDDDSNIDLDEDSTVAVTKKQAPFDSHATRLPNGTSKHSLLETSAATLLPDGTSNASAARQTPASSAPIPWSSSPPSHHIPNAANTSKRRTIPWLEKPSSSDNTEGQNTEESRPKKPSQHKQDISARTKKEIASKKDAEMTNTSQRRRHPLPHVQAIIDRDKGRKAKERNTTEEDAEEVYTPLPKDTANSPYPWNKTASALKEEQKKLRQGHKTLVKEGKGDTSKPKKKRESVARVFLSDEQKSVLNLVSEKKKSVFFTGSAGTGKSVLLRETIKVLRDKYKREPDRVAVTASTGLAACNVGGVTLHSYAGVGLGKEDVPALVRKVKKSQKAKNRWMRTKVLIVDEISMVDGELFDKLEALARAIRNNGRPFGGIQLVITGDFFQLPPVPDYHSVAKFAFDAATWNTSIEHTIGLTQIFRQKDPVFANMLNEMRLGRLTPKSVNSFRALGRPLSFDDEFEATELFPTRNEVENANNARMRKLSGKEFEFKAEDGGSMTDLAQRERLLTNCMAPSLIKLKKGAQVMLIKNIDDTLVNGSVGKVIAFMDERTFDIYHEDEDEFQAVETMDLNDEEMTRSRLKLKQLINKDLAGDTSQKWPLVRFSIQDGTTRDLLCQRESWKIELPSGEVQASRAQVPLILAWALSIHKAQGQTLDRVKVDLGKIFEKGQAYVALSRATCQEGLQIVRFDPAKVMAHERVRTFYNSLYSIDQAGSKANQASSKANQASASNETTAPAPAPAPAPAQKGQWSFPDQGLDEDEDALAVMQGY